MPLYLTGLIAIEYWRFPAFPYSTRHWKLHLVSTSESETQTVWSKSTSGRRIRNKGKEIAIEARDDAAAERAAFNLDAAAQVLDGDAFLSRFAGRIQLRKVTGLRSGRSAIPSSGTRPATTRSNLNIPLECLLAVATARRRNRTYALTKLWLSLQIFSISVLDLEPSRPIIPKSRNPLDHVSYATAIVLAYAAIEELGLEIRATKEQPSTIDGAWNPVVREALERRLLAAGIDLAENYHWQIRGSKTRLEKVRPPRKVRASPWAKWHVRDVEVTLVDAIAHVSWLRSKVAAHRMQYESARALSAYDVANAQYLARRLFLESLGFWRPGPGDLEIDIETRVGT